MRMQMKKRKETKMYLQSDQKCLQNKTKRLSKKIEVVNALLWNKKT